MSTQYYLIDDTKADGSKLHGAEWDVLVRILDAQLQGALALHGTGVAAIPDESSLLVEVDNGAALLNPGAGVLLHSTAGHVWAKVKLPVPIQAGSFPNQNSDQNFVFIALQVANTAGAPDTRQNATPQLAISAFDQLDGHLLLAQVTLQGGVVTDVADLRSFLPSLSKNALWSLFLGSGRIVGATRTEGQPVKVNNSLKVVLPAGSQWYIEGQFLELDLDVEIDVPANQADGVWGKLSIDTAGLPTVETADWLSVAPARGVGVLGLIKTDATKVVSVSETTRDIIQPEPAKQVRFETIEALLTTLSGGGDTPPDPGAAVTIAMYNILKQALDDLTVEVAAIKASLGTESPIALRLSGRVETLRAEHSRLAASVVRNSPRTGKRLKSAVVLPGLTGIHDNLPGGDHQGAHYIGGNLKINRAKRRLE